MAKGLPTINLHLAKAQGCCTTIRALLRENMHEDDRKQYDDLLVDAENSMDRASALLSELRSRLDGVSDQL